MTIPKSILLATIMGALTFTIGTVPPIHAAIGFEAPAPAENLKKPPTVTTQHHINVDGKILEPIKSRPNVVYVDAQPLVALRQTAEALGYTVTWDAITRTVLVDMSIATLVVNPNQAQVIRKGKLQIINLNTTESMLPMPRLIDGQLFVSPNTFILLFNDVKISRDEIFITPQRATLANTESTKGSSMNSIATFLPPEPKIAFGTNKAI